MQYINRVITSILPVVCYIVIPTSISAQICAWDSLEIEKTTVEFIMDTSLVTYDYGDSIVHQRVNRVGEFNKEAPIERILSVQNVIDSLKSNRIIFRQVKFSVDCYIDESYGYFDFSKASCVGIEMDFYEQECQTIPFVKYYWEFDAAPGFITIILLTGYDNCFF